MVNNPSSFCLILLGICEAYQE